MATFTTRLGLRKPAGSDSVNVTTDIDDNMDKIDTAMGFERVSSFPVSPYTGKGIHRSDQLDQAWFYNGSAWVDLQGRTLVAGKSADQTINNNGTLVNDSELAITNLRANAWYLIDLLLIYTSVSATPDIRYQFTTPAGAFLKWIPLGLDPTATTESGILRMGTQQTGGGTKTLATIAGTEVGSRACGLLTMAGTGGTIQVQWSQNTATAENTTVKAYSLLTATRLI